MKSELKAIIILALSFCLVYACKSKKDIKKTEIESTKKESAKPEINEIKSVLNNVHANEIILPYYQSKGSASYKDDKQSANFDVTIVMEKDKYIWVSVTALLGIEVARMLITQDSVKILDRLHRKCIVSNFDYINKIANAKLELNNLQNLFLGNTLFDNSVQKSVVDSVLGNLAIISYLQSQKQYTVYSNKFRPLRGSITHNQQQRELRYTYDNFYNFGQSRLPSKLNINIRAEKNLECSLELSNFVFDKKREVQFTVPSNYEVVKP